MGTIEERGRSEPPAEPAPSVGIESLRALLPDLRAVRHLLFFLDYDGTLVAFAPTPDLARPDREILALLGRLAGRPGTEVHVASGRRRDTLGSWLGGLPIGLHAEHGF